MEAQTKARKKRVPVLDMSRCSECESCIELHPELFRRNPETDGIEIMDLPEYPEEKIQEAINCCPRDCIAWEDV
jgi:ferredoxin